MLVIILDVYLLPKFSDGFLIDQWVFLSRQTEKLFLAPVATL